MSTTEPIKAEPTNADPIKGCIDRWFEHLRGDLDGGLDSLLREDCVFLSPVVFTPQVGREITKLYLTAAGNTLGDGDGEGHPDQDGAFGYSKVIREGNHAMLEFNTVLRDDEGRDIAVNGVDIITCDDDGMITEFRVMLRPLQAVNVVHAQMKAMLERLAAH